MAEIYQPTLVIGLGGTGKNILLALKKMIAENCEHGMADFPFLKLLSIDTDRAIPETKSTIKTIRDDALSLNQNREVFQLQVNFGTTPDLNDYPKIHEWYPDSLKSNLNPASLSRGASQKKPIGRFMFAWNASQIYQEVNDFLRAPVNVKIAIDKNIGSKLSKEINVFICGSVCGGTGAGTFLDTAYLVRYCNKVSGAGYRVKIFGILALASMFDNIQGTANVRQNCYASLVELDYFMNKINYDNPYRAFYPAYNNFNPNYSGSSNVGPFDYPFLFDNFGKGVALNSQSAFSEMAARFIYLLTGHELGQHWESMYNNVLANLERNYKNNLKKDIHYDGMGTYSILYPKRMIVQLCAYNLSKEYFSRILDDSYAPKEIETLAKNFLKDIKMNPETTQLEDFFENFNDNNGFQGKFKDYLEEQISDFEERAKEISKKDLTNEIRTWKKDVEQKIQEFKNANSTVASKVRESFLGQLKKYLETLIDLHEKKLGVKKNSDGTDLIDRGSVVRTEKFVIELHKIFSDAKEKYRKIRNDAESTIANYNSDFETALSDFDEISDGIFSGKKKIQDTKEKILEACRDLFNAKKQNLIADWCYQLFDGILWNDVPKYAGLLKELENYEKNYQKVIVSFKELDSEIGKFLEENRRFEPSPLFTTIFDYDKDVVETYKELIADKSEEYIFGGISDSLTEEKAFGKDYLGATKKTSSLMNIDILNAAEKFFFEPVNKKNIADRILDTPEICARIEDGTYFISAPVYLSVEETVMNREGLNFKNSEFYAISIPDQYEGKPCKDIKGPVSNNDVCPMEKDPETYQNNPCPMFNRCLKQKLLHNAPGNISITPTSELSEVNIMHSIAGYPLYALSSVMNNCKPEYVKAKEKQKKDNEENGTEYEEINMFGPLQFDALDEKTVNPKAKEDEFRRKILAAVIAKRIVCQALSVDFVTERDLQLGRIDNPSLHLGDSIDEVMRKFQSSKISDKKIIDQFEKESEHYLEKLAENDKLKENFGRKAQKVYAEFKKDLPAGFKDTDLDLMDSLTKEYCGFELINKTPLTDDMFIIGDE